MPVVVGTWGDDVTVHCPVMVFAESEAVGGMVVARLGKRNEVRGIDKGNIVSGWKADPQAACSALVVIDVEDELAEGRAAAVFLWLFGNE